MTQHKQKTLSYRRAVWLSTETETLESRLDAARRRRRTVALRSFTKINGQVIKAIACQSSRLGGFVLHVTSETPGDRASVLQTAQDEDELIAVGTAIPPSNSEFMDGDIFAYIRNNDVCICSTTLRDPTLAWFLKEMFSAARLPVGAMQFDLRKVAQLDRLRMLSTQGVKEIHLGTTLYEATTTYEGRQHQFTGVLSAAGRHISALFGSDRRPTPDNLKVSVNLKADGRMRSGEVLGYRRINSIAAELIDSDDDYTIVTRTGQKITPETVVVKKVVELPVYGKSVTRESAIRALTEFYSDLARSGALET